MKKAASVETALLITYYLLLQTCNLYYLHQFNIKYQFLSS